MFFFVFLYTHRTPQWLKKMFQAVMKSERNGPVFQFFIDLGDAVSYVKRLNIPSGVVGACRLDLAYEHFKEKPHLFQFIPNERQVKEANKLLKNAPQNTRKKKVEGVPVFTAQNLDIAIATADGIKWYTPYFFNKSMLDDILEDSVNQHFDSLIQTRHLQRRRDIIDDDNIASDLLDDNTDNVWEPPEVQEVMDEMGAPSIPLSIITKAAEMQLLYTVDKVLLGNRWFRKATGIQPKFPYVVDSFEKRSAASFEKASMLPHAENNQLQQFNPSKHESQDEHNRLTPRHTLMDGSVNGSKAAQRRPESVAFRPLNEPNEHEHRYVHVRSFNFNRTRTYNRTNFFGHVLVYGENGHVRVRLCLFVESLNEQFTNVNGHKQTNKLKWT
ncbi:hypothetical protein Hdeb2414_s0494g00905151 [Helianthus debilis subsp. tardiflorus]